MNIRWCRASLLGFILIGALFGAACTRPGAVVETGAQDDTADSLRSDDLSVSSSAFLSGGQIPVDYAFGRVPDGQNRSLPLSWVSEDPQIQSFVVLLTDEHEIAQDFVHWLVVDIPSDVRSLVEGASGTVALPAGSRELTNDYGLAGYGGPWPPAGSGRHEYRLTVYGLNTATVVLTGQVSRADLLENIASHIVATGSTTGYFEL